MRNVLVIALLVFAPSLVMSQDADRDRQADEVKQAVGQVAGSKKTTVRIVRHDLREFNGKVVAVDGDFFAIQLKEKDKALITFGRSRRKPPPFVIKYTDVLQLEGKGVLLSYVPGPTSSPFSTWDKLKSIGVGEFLQVNLDNGKRTHGVFMRCTDDKIALIRGNTVTDISRENVTRVFRVTGGTSSFASKLLKGGQKGMEVADDIFPILDPSARAHPGALAIGSGVGALLFFLPKGRTNRVLAFAK